MIQRTLGMETNCYNMQKSIVKAGPHESSGPWSLVPRSTDNTNPGMRANKICLDITFYAVKPEIYEPHGTESDP